MPKAWLIGGAAFVGVLLVASAVLVLIQRQQTFAPGTPARAVQDFLRAYTDEDFDRVYELWAEELGQDCTRDEYIEAVVGRDVKLSDNRITVTDTEYVGETEERAVVLVRVSRTTDAGPFKTSESDHRQRYTLALEQGEWRFTQVPWPSAGCSPTTPTKTPALPPRTGPSGLDRPQTTGNEGLVRFSGQQVPPYRGTL